MLWNCLCKFHDDSDVPVFVLMIAQFVLWGFLRQTCRVVPLMAMCQMSKVKIKNDLELYGLRQLEQQRVQINWNMNRGWRSSQKCTFKMDFAHLVKLFLLLGAQELKADGIFTRIDSVLHKTDWICSEWQASQWKSKFQRVQSHQHWQRAGWVSVLCALIPNYVKFWSAWNHQRAPPGSSTVCRMLVKLNQELENNLNMRQKCLNKTSSWCWSHEVKHAENI